MTDRNINPPERRPRYQWPDATPGNTIALKHGAHSPRLVEPRAQAILDEVLPEVTWWRPSDLPAARAWATTEARVQLISEWLARAGGEAGGLLDGAGGVRSATVLLVRLEAQAANQRARLGLDPLARFKLGRDASAINVDVAQLMAELHRQPEAEGDGSGAVVPGDGPEGEVTS